VLCFAFLASQSPAQESPGQQPPAQNTATNGTTSNPTPDQAPKPLDANASKLLQTAKSEGFPLATETVADHVSVEAVLLPPKVCNRVFGKEIAQNFAAVELTISNRSSQNALILHSVFIEYGALSGSLYLRPKPTQAANSEGGSSNKGNGTSGHKATQSHEANSNPNQTSSKESPPDGQNPTQSYQAASNPTQISSVEYRVARGDLLDAQPWTTRNWGMRALVLAGAVASAYAFSINEQGIIRGIAAFSGQVVPAADTF